MLFDLKIGLDSYRELLKILDDLDIDVEKEAARLHLEIEPKELAKGTKTSDPHLLLSHVAFELQKARSGLPADVTKRPELGAAAVAASHASVAQGMLIAMGASVYE